MSVPVETAAQVQRRAVIRAVMADSSLTEQEKAKKVQAMFLEPMVAPLSTTEVGLGSAHGSVVTPSATDLLPTFQDEARTILGCQHYQQQCKILAPCCNAWFTCRLCHDALSDHEIDRYAIKTMLCISCKTVQPTAERCCNCATQMAQYYCNICHIWENKHDRPIYHCNDCRICRVGQGLNMDYFHCETCDICMSVSMRGRHKCVEKSLHSNCPICFEYMFTSTKHVVFMRCGHSIHSQCYDQYRRTSYQCPLCAKSHQDMTDYFRAIDTLLRKQPMPIEFSGWTTTLFCNDCGVRGNVPYHFEYHKCPQVSCGSYNTNMISVEKNEPLPQEEYDKLIAAQLSSVATDHGGHDDDDDDDNEQIGHFDNEDQQEDEDEEGAAHEVDIGGDAALIM